MGSEKLPPATCEALSKTSCAYVGSPFAGCRRDTLQAVQLISRVARWGWGDKGAGWRRLVLQGLRAVSPVAPKGRGRKRAGARCRKAGAGGWETRNRVRLNCNAHIIAQELGGKVGSHSTRRACETRGESGIDRRRWDRATVRRWGRGEPAPDRSRRSSRRESAAARRGRLGNVPRQCESPFTIPTNREVSGIDCQRPKSGSGPAGGR